MQIQILKLGLLPKYEYYNKLLQYISKVATW